MSNLIVVGFPSLMSREASPELSTSTEHLIFPGRCVCRFEHDQQGQCAAAFSQ